MSHAEVLDQIRCDAMAAYQEDREPVAVELLTVYVRHMSDDAYAWHVLGDSLRVIGRFGDAENALLRALELAPDDKGIAVSSRIAMLYKDMGRHTEAEHYFAEVTAHAEWQDLGWVWILRGANLARLGEFQSAEECHRRATMLVDVDHDEAWLNLGLVLRAQARYDEARDALRTCLEYDVTGTAAEDALQSMQGIENAAEAVRLLNSRQ